jgi:hypothetical protein
VLAVQAVVRDQLVGPFGEQRLGQWVGEEVRLIVDDEVAARAAAAVRAVSLILAEASVGFTTTTVPGQ